MRKVFVILVLAGLFAVRSFAAAPSVTAPVALLMDLESGNILFEKDINQRMFPASTTKVMTALIVFDAENKDLIKLSDVVTVRADAIEGLPIDGSNMALKAGEEITVENLLKGMLINSANDASNMLALHVSGSIEAFVEAMNARAAELGLLGTHFTNAHGLHDDEHYTTAYDLAACAREAMKYKGFRNIVDIAHIKIPPTNMTGERYYINTNNLVGSQRYRQFYYDKAIGVKTGNTSAAGQCLIAAAKSGDKQVLSVVMKCGSVEVSHVESKALLQYGFDDFTRVKLMSIGDIPGEAAVSQGRGADHVALKVAEEVYVLLPAGVKAEQLEKRSVITAVTRAPIAAGQLMGNMDYYFEGKRILSVPLYAEREVKRHPLGWLMSMQEFLWRFMWFRVVCYVLAVALGFYLALLFIGIRRSLVRMNRRRRRSQAYAPPPEYELRQKNVRDIRKGKK